ncbi:MAG: type II toxin-antitoxin system VapC family toxin [Rhodobacteraceae bacterium]|nr:type II toxin-antitoxin system VapC family toxin [Paracoccaceae bacterium]MCY4196206.1 type II toxin-antitoxin system VapC family toxin [Paracoccaceae bacterium]
MTRVIVNDASCLIDLRKGRLLHVLCALPYEFIVPLPVRASEILDFTPQEWALLDSSGMATYGLSPAEVGQAFDIKKRHGCLSANDCFCLVTAQVHAEAILLTGDRLLRRAAQDNGIIAHGVLWVVDQLLRDNLCDPKLLETALTLWRDDKAVFLPNHLIDNLLRRVR